MVYRRQTHENQISVKYFRQSSIQKHVLTPTKLTLSSAYPTHVAHTGLKANTNKTQTQADLRGSPKPGTSTEAADCILMEE